MRFSSLSVLCSPYVSSPRDTKILSCCSLLEVLDYSEARSDLYSLHGYICPIIEIDYLKEDPSENGQPDENDHQTHFDYQF